MAPADRTLRKLRNGASELSTKEVLSLLHSLGWTFREGSSHHIATSPLGLNIPISRKPKVRREYLQKLLEEIDRSGGI